MAGEEPRLHDHLEIHSLIDGGYVVRQGRFDYDMSERQDQAVWTWKQERAAFSSLEDALKWVSQQMVLKSPEIGRLGDRRSRSKRGAST